MMAYNDNGTLKPIIGRFWRVIKMGFPLTVDYKILDFSSSTFDASITSFAFFQKFYEIHESNNFAKFLIVANKSPKELYVFVGIEAGNMCAE
jgi:hypothetical protein